MKNKNFYDVNQASQYLRHSVIMIGGEPGYIYDVVKDARYGMLITFCALTRFGGDVSTIPIDDKKVDMNPVSLGMCSYFDGGTWNAFYVSRIPVRKWKIGLAKDNVSIDYLLGQGHVDRMYNNVLFPSASLASCILGKHPTIKEASDRLDTHGGIVPISRHFAICNGGKLYYRTAPECVGTWTKRNGPKLDDNFLFLSEVLKENINARA